VPPIGERVIRLKVDFGTSDRDATKLKESLKDVGTGTQDASKSFLSFGQNLAKTALVITAITAASTGLYKAFQSGLMNPARWGSFGVMVQAAFEKLKVGAFGVIGVLESVHKHTTVLDHGIVAATKPLGPFISRLIDIGLSAEAASLVLGTMGGPVALRVAAGFALVAKGAATTVVSITALTYAVGALATSIGNRLETATNSWLESGLEFQKQQFGLELAVKGFGKAVDGTSTDVKKLVKDIQDIATETGVAATEIKQGANIMYEMSKVTHLTGDQINNLLKYMADFATVRGVAFTDVVYAIDQSFRGWNRAASALGLALDDASIKTEAAKQGWIDSKSAADVNIDTTLKYKSAIQGMTFALGANAAQLDILPGVLRRLNGELQQIHNQLGIGVSRYWYPYYNILLQIVSGIRNALGPGILQAIGYLTGFVGSTLQAAGAALKWGSAIVVLVSSIRLLQSAMLVLGKFTVVEQLATSFFNLGIVAKTLNFFGAAKSASALATSVGFLGQRLSTFHGIIGLVIQGVTKFATGTLLALGAALLKPLIIIGLVVGAMYLLVKAFQLIEARTQIFSKAWDALGQALEELKNIFGGAGSVLLDVLVKVFTIELIELIHATAAAIILLAAPFVVVSIAISGLIEMWYRFRKVMGGNVEAELEQAEKQTRSLEKQLGKLGSALLTVIQPSEVFGKKLDKNALAAAEVVKVMGALNEQEVAAIQKLSQAAELVGRSNIWEELSRKVLLLKNQLVSLGVIDPKEHEAAIKKLGRDTQKAQYEAIGAFIELFGKSNDVLDNELQILDKMLEANAISEEDRLAALNKVFTDKYNERNNIIRQSVQERLNIESEVTSELLRLKGNVGGAINIERETATNNIRIELENKLMEIRKSGIEVTRRSHNAEMVAVAEIVKVEKDAFDKRKAFILEFNARQTEALTATSDAQASYTEAALVSEYKVYEADKFNLERKGLLIKKETSDRIIAIKSMNLSAVESERLITLAQEKESAQRKQLAIEESEARKKAIREAGQAAQGFALGEGKSDLEIIKEKGIRRLTPAEEAQILETKKQRAEQRRIDAARNPLAFGNTGTTFSGAVDKTGYPIPTGRPTGVQGPAAPLTAVAFEEIQKLKEFRTGQRAGVSAQVAGGSLDVQEGAKQLAAIDQALGEKIKDLSDKFPQFKEIFDKFASDIASGKEETPQKTAAEQAQENQLKAIDSNTAALGLLAENIDALNASIEPFLKQLQNNPIDKRNIAQAPIDINGKKIQVDPLNPVQPPNARTSLDLLPAKANPALNPFYSTAEAAKKFPSLVDEAMLAAQDKFIERLRIMTEEGEKGIGKLGVSLYQTIIDQMDQALDEIKTRV